MSKASQSKKIAKKAARRKARKLPTANQPTPVEAIGGSEPVDPQPLRREAEVASVATEDQLEEWDSAPVIDPLP